MTDERVGEASEPTSSLLDEQRIGRNVIAVDCTMISTTPGSTLLDNRHLLATLFGGSNGSCLNGYRL